MTTCKCCGGGLKLMGTLGNLTWYRCVCCGLEQYVEGDQRCL
jgi:hypothetical protein